MEEQPLLAKLRAQGDAVRTVAPIRLVQFHAVPGPVRLPQEGVEAHALTLVLHVPQRSPRGQQAHEAVDVGVLLQERPVEPGGRVVVAVGVVVALLRAPDLVPHQDHGHAQRHQRESQVILHLAVAQPLDLGVLGRAFDAAVPAPVVVGAVAVVLAVRLVVLVVVGDEVVEREAVVAGHEVDALLGLALLVAVDLGAPDQPVRHAPHRPGAPRKKSRTSSRKRPFHSFQASPTKLPTW